MAKEGEVKGTQVDKHYYVYLLASGRNGTLYTGVTGDILTRIWNHRNGTLEGFTKTYRVHLLVWYEAHQDINAAIMREKKIKKMESRVEDCADREDEFRLERPLRTTSLKQRILRQAPGFP